MPPKAATIVYGPLNPAPEQARFSHRRKNVRQPTVPPPSLLKRQSTLSQVGWIDTPSSNNSRGKKEPITTSSDAEDEEYGVPQRRTRSMPKRKPRSNRKKLEKTESQPSFTQAIRSAPAKMAKRAREADGEGFQIWQDPDDPADTPMERIAKRRKRWGEVGMHLTDLVALHDGGYESRRGPRWSSPEIAESSSQVPVDQDDDEVATENATRVTPRNFRFKELPSSQSPASVQLSTQRSQRFADTERSPLKARDGNARLPVKQLRLQKLQAGEESQISAQKMLMLMETQAGDEFNVRLEDDEGGYDGGDARTEQLPKRSLMRTTTVPDSTDTESEDEIVERDAKSPPPTVRRARTVQESQLEFGADEDQDGGEDKGEREDEAKGDHIAMTSRMPPMPPPQPRLRKLKRVATVQDSQIDDLDLELHDETTLEGDGVAETKHQKDGNDVLVQDHGTSMAEPEGQYRAADGSGTIKVEEALEEQEQRETDEEVAEEVAEHEAEHGESRAEEAAEEDEFYEDATYDPAYSALDRDAARFTQITQTQGLRPELYDSNDGDLDDVSQGAIDNKPFKDRDLDEGEYTAAHQLSQELSDAAEAVVPSSQPAEQTRNIATSIKDSQPSAAEKLVSSGLKAKARVSAAEPDDAVGEDEERAPSSPPPATLPPFSKPSFTFAYEPEPKMQPDLAGLPEQGEERVPSSPPTLRPSQVSTVVPTQLSLAGPGSRRADGTQTQWSYRSPHKMTQSRWHEDMMATGSSSPLPLPPWSSPERARYIVGDMGLGGGKGRHMTESMVDFSLPPPPPISSSRVGTQSGGRSSSPLPL
ncbi:hypothetical protein B0A55_06726 [Friedmanniomyces simplex]|uniref:Uncharacterized protein n=1 Tax=Friedmanniomyces simplex TaxID=329884 RepID=A0A4U0X0V9_9PEZI|nr:hypothetical protein B0A55_06726 [Friedmanniomyces simplex]